MPAEKEDKQKEEEEEEMGGMNGRLWRYGNVQGLVRTRNDHIIFLPNPSCAQTKAFSSPLHVAMRRLAAEKCSTYQLAALRRT